jgi:hypothetical protein
MASTAYYEWIDAGEPYTRATPTLQLKAVIKSHGFVVYDYPNTAHLQAEPPEDHTPFSATGWPITSKRWVGHAIDIMPKTDDAVGQAELTRLARQIIADKDAGVPGTKWLKYINWTDENGNCWQTSWKPTKKTVSSTDKRHIHLSGRSDMDTSTEVADTGWDPVARMSDDMTPSQGYVQHVMNYRVDAIRGMRLSIVIPPYTAPTGETFPGMTEPNNLAIAITKLQNDEASITQTIKDEIAAAVAQLNDVTLTDAQIDEIATKTAAGVSTTLDIPTAEENAAATVQEFGKEITN